jgi:hypothetical protein
MKISIHKENKILLFEHGRFHFSIQPLPFKATHLKLRKIYLNILMTRYSTSISPGWRYYWIWFTFQLDDRT